MTILAGRNTLELPRKGLYAPFAPTRLKLVIVPFIGTDKIEIPAAGELDVLVGLGRIGTHVARRLVNWDVKLIACDPYVAPEHVRKLGVTIVELPTRLAEADVVTLHCVLTEETRLLMDEKALKQMKPSAVLINTARGEIADEDAIARALKRRMARRGGRRRVHAGAAARVERAAHGGSRALDLDTAQHRAP